MVCTYTCTTVSKVSTHGHLPYSGKCLYSSYEHSICKNRNFKNFMTLKQCVSLNLTTHGEQLHYVATSVLLSLWAAYPESCQHQLEGKKAHKAGGRLSCSAILTVGEHGLAAPAYEIKIYSVHFLIRYTKIYTNKNFPLYGIKSG